MANDNAPKKPGGYGQPPADKQFKKGQSGNPNGRPKGSKNGVMAEVSRYLNKVHDVKVNGKHSRKTGSQLVAARLFDGAMKGEKAALELVLKMEQQSPSVVKDLRKELEETKKMLEAEKKNASNFKLYLPAPYVHALEEEMMIDPDVAIQMVKDNPKLFDEYIRAFHDVRGVRAPPRDEDDQ